MNKVYFIRNLGTDYAQLGKDALILLKRIISEIDHQLDKEVPIKVHFGI